MIKRLWASIKAFFYTPVAATESQPKENTVKLALVSIITSMLANGATANTVQVTLTDNADAIQPGAVVSFTADNGATVNPTSALTDANGQITVSLVSSNVGASTLTATAADGTTASIQVYSVAVPTLPATVNVSDPAAPADASATSIPVKLSPLEAMKEDFDKVVAFIEHGIEVLGKDAEADLVALKNKFLL